MIILILAAPFIALAAAHSPNAVALWPIVFRAPGAPSRGSEQKACFVSDSGVYEETLWDGGPGGARCKASRDAAAPRDTDARVHAPDQPSASSPGLMAGRAMI